MSPPTRESRPATNGAARTNVGTAVTGNDTRLVPVDPVTVHLLSSIVPCELCDDRGLCGRCWVVARAVEELVIAGRRDQARDDLAVAA